MAQQTEPGTEEKKTFRQKVREASSRAWAGLRNWLGGFKMAPGWERGAAWAGGALVFIFGAYAGTYSYTGFSLWLEVVGSAVLYELIYLVVLFLGSRILRLLFRLPPLLWVALVGVFVAGTYFWNDYTWVNLALIGASVLGVFLLGVSVHAYSKGDWAGAPTRKKVLLVVMTVLGAALFVGMAILFFLPGIPAEPLPVQVLLGASSIDAPNPSQPGEYEVLTLTYGSGTDRWRPEYGKQADILTETVNASSYVGYSGFDGKMREWYWGFSPAQTPVNGRVWYPDGEGPFPLVLIVHGNHTMTDFSDPGYAYLGELFASRGFIAVSVDQNFFNGGTYGKSSGENDARAWLLLQHIEAWEDWNNDPDSPFYHLVDMDNIALIGHSRGGEAVVHAAIFNRLSRYPNNARITWDFNYNIKAVAAIAPVDQQYRPADHPAELVDVSYLVLQGSHDSDLDTFQGGQQFQRASFSDGSPGFAASLYIYRANHGQFNTVWGDRDAKAIKGQFLNRRALLSGEEQRQIASLYLSAFLEATLHGESAYRPIFQDYRTAGDWLPQTSYINGYRDAGVRYLATYEEDYIVDTTTLDGGKIQLNGGVSWNEMQLRFRDGKRQDNHVVRLWWGGTEGKYILTFPPNTAWQWGLGEETLLVFSAADGREPEDSSEGLDFSIMLTDSLGGQVVVLASDILPLQTQFPAQISRMPTWNTYFYHSESEAVLQSYRIPLSTFTAQNPDLDLDKLVSITFLFDQPPTGTIYLDDIGFDLIP